MAARPRCRLSGHRGARLLRPFLLVRHQVRVVYSVLRRQMTSKGSPRERSPADVSFRPPPLPRLPVKGIHPGDVGVFAQA